MKLNTKIPVNKGITNSDKWDLYFETNDSEYSFTDLCTFYAHVHMSQIVLKLLRYCILKGLHNLPHSGFEKLALEIVICFSVYRKYSLFFLIMNAVY